MMRNCEEVQSVPGKARLRCLKEIDVRHLLRWRGFPLGGKCRVFRQSAVLQGSRVRHVLRRRSSKGDGRPPEGRGAPRFREVRQAAALSLPRAVHGSEALYRSWASSTGFEQCSWPVRRCASRGAEAGRGPGPRGRPYAILDSVTASSSPRSSPCATTYAASSPEMRQ